MKNKTTHIDIDTTRSRYVTVWHWKDLPLKNSRWTHRVYHNVTLYSLKRAQRAQLALATRKEATK